MDKYASTLDESVELLIESLIKMTGKTNEHVSTLQSRIAQLEKRLGEHENEWKSSSFPCPAQLARHAMPEMEKRLLFHL